MKIYTRTGDTGTTSLIGGKRVPKHHARIEAYGTVDELNSHIGLLRDMVVKKEIKETLLFIQDRLMICATILATDSKDHNIKPLKFSEDDIKFIEKEIDKIQKQLKPLKFFIIPGGHVAVSQCHITRTICRRAERNVLALHQKDQADPFVLAFLNRLSDYFFVLARHLAKINKVKETPWVPEYQKDIQITSPLFHNKY